MEVGLDSAGDGEVQKGFEQMNNMTQLEIQKVKRKNQRGVHLRLGGAEQNGMSAVQFKG